MDLTDELFPNYDENGRSLIRKAYGIAEKALAGRSKPAGVFYSVNERFLTFL